MDDDVISRQMAIDVVEESRRLNHHQDGKTACAHEYEHRHFLKILRDLPSAQPDIKQAAKLLSDFIESCLGGDSYLITPDGEELRTDWGYATEGIQLILDWAERRTDG